MSQPIEVTDQNFEEKVLRSDIPVLVDFWAPWCGPCRAIGPSLEEIAGELDGKLKVAKMNIDENPNIPAQFGVRSIPYLVFMNGGEVVDSILGAMPKPKIRSAIEKNFQI